MQHVKQWLAKNVPRLAGAVVAIVFNPLMGKQVEAASETLAAEFRRRFGPANSMALTHDAGMPLARRGLGNQTEPYHLRTVSYTRRAALA